MLATLSDDAVMKQLTVLPARAAHRRRAGTVGVTGALSPCLAGGVLLCLPDDVVAVRHLHNTIPLHVSHRCACVGSRLHSGKIQQRRHYVEQIDKGVGSLALGNDLGIPDDELSAYAALGRRSLEIAEWGHRGRGPSPAILRVIPMPADQN